MQAVLDFINNHVRDIFIPLTALALLRVGMCLAQLKRMTHLREKKGAYHAVRGHCEELGVWFGALAGFALGFRLPHPAGNVTDGNCMHLAPSPDEVLSGNFHLKNRSIFAAMAADGDVCFAV